MIIDINISDNDFKALDDILDGDEDGLQDAMEVAIPYAAYVGVQIIANWPRHRDVRVRFPNYPN